MSIGECSRSDWLNMKETVETDVQVKTGPAKVGWGCIARIIKKRNSN